jgi:hypothetical protein
MRAFRRYNVWDISHQFVLKIYKTTKQFPKRKNYHRFVTICLGSAHEWEYFILLAKDLKDIDFKTFEALTKEINEIKRKLYSRSKKLIAYIK